MCDVPLPSARRVRKRWAQIPKRRADEFIEHCKQHGKAEAITLAAGTVLRASESLHADRVLLREVTFDATHNWPDAHLNDSDLYQCTLCKVVFDPPAHWTRARIVACDLRGANLHKADFTGTIFEATKLEGADLSGAILRNAHFCNTSFNSKTQLTDAVLEDTTFDQEAVDQLGDALKPEQRRLIKIATSPVARLDESFGRPKALLVHICFLLLFLAPYLYFLLKTALTAKACPEDGPCTTALAQLIDYVLDRATGAGCVRFATGVICLAYNTLRVILIIKANLLQRARKRPNTAADADYNDSHWPRVHDIANWLFWVNVAATIVHLLTWFLRPIIVV